MSCYLESELKVLRRCANGDRQVARCNRLHISAQAAAPLRQPQAQARRVPNISTTSIRALVLGSGRRLFPDGTAPACLRLLGSVTTTTGVMIATYQPA